MKTSAFTPCSPGTVKNSRRSLLGEGEAPAEPCWIRYTARQEPHPPATVSPFSLDKEGCCFSCDEERSENSLSLTRQRFRGATTFLR